MIGIPKNLGHIWIGPNPAPTQWFQTWIDKHPDWNYRIYDNQFLENFNFKNRDLINFYLKLRWYAGAADLMRYEILYEFGGFIPGADSICYENTNELFTQPCAYTVYENEFVRGKLTSPILACEPKNPFVKTLIEELSKLTTDELDEPWRTTGNLFIARMIENENPEITIFPSHYFIPVHYEGIIYQGTDKIYCKQLFGSTRDIYKKKEKIREPFFRRKMNRKISKDIEYQKDQILKTHADERRSRFQINVFSN